MHLQHENVSMPFEREKYNIQLEIPEKFTKITLKLERYINCMAALHCGKGNSICSLF